MRSIQSTSEVLGTTRGGFRKAHLARGRARLEEINRRLRNLLEMDLMRRRRCQPHPSDRANTTPDTEPFDGDIA